MTNFSNYVFYKTQNMTIRIQTQLTQDNDMFGNPCFLAVSLHKNLNIDLEIDFFTRS